MQQKANLQKNAKINGRFFGFYYIFVYLCPIKNIKL